MPCNNEMDNIQGINRTKILKESLRVVNRKGIVIINGFLKIPNQELGILNIFDDWIKNNYSDITLYSRDDFRKILSEAGAKNIDLEVKNGILFGYGSKGPKNSN